MTGLFLIFQPAFNAYRSYWGDVTDPEGMQFCDIQGRSTFGNVSQVEIYGMRAVKVKRGIYRLESVNQ